MQTPSSATLLPKLPPLGAPRSAPGGLGTSLTLRPARPSQASGEPGAREFTDRERKLQMAYALQDVARNLLPSERVAGCYRRPITADISMLYVGATNNAYFGGTMVCGSCWTCPVCGRKISRHRGDEIERGLRTAKALGYKVVMVTYTFRHHREFVLQNTLNRFLHAFRGMKSARDYKTLREQYIVGTIRGLEVTHGEINGWHPHIHEIYILAPNTDIVAFSDVLRGMWEHAAAREGLDMDEHGFRLDSTDARIARYVAKFQRDPAEKTLAAWEAERGRWNEAAELTQWHRKRGHDEHYTPFDLLAFAMAGDERAGFLFREYAKAFRGKSQVRWSPGLRKLLGVGPEKTDKEIAEEHEQVASECGVLDRKAFKRILKRGARARVLIEIQRCQGDPDHLSRWMRRIYGVSIQVRRLKAAERDRERWKRTAE